jgi:hypothetical protein
MKFTFLKAAIFSLVLSVSGFAGASTISFEFETDDGTISLDWSLTEGQSADSSDLDSSAFFLTDYVLTVNNAPSAPSAANGTTSGLTTITFYDASFSGGFSFAGDSVLIDSTSEVLFTVSTSEPTFKMGEFQTEDFNNTGPEGVLTITKRSTPTTNVSTPTTVAIIALGILCLTTRRFKKQS